MFCLHLKTLIMESQTISALKMVLFPNAIAYNLII